MCVPQNVSRAVGLEDGSWTSVPETPVCLSPEAVELWRNDSAG